MLRYMERGIGGEEVGGERVESMWGKVSEIDDRENNDMG
jgi:hypothetical protein